MIDLQNKKFGFRCLCLVVILLLHNLGTCTTITTFHDESIDPGNVNATPTSSSGAEQTKPMIVTASPHSTPPASNRTETLPPRLFPTNSPNSSSNIPIINITDVSSNISSHLLSSSSSSSAKDNSSSPVYLPTQPASAAAPDAESHNMLSTKYDGRYDVDQIKNLTKKYNQTKETKDVTKPPSVVDSKKDTKNDSSTNVTTPSTPETPTVEDASKTETKPLPENKNKTNVVAAGKAEETHRGEAKLIVAEPPHDEPPSREVAPPRKSTSTLREIGKTLAAILVIIVGTASMLFVGFVVWRRISRRYYGHREMLINEDDFEEVSDLHHFEGSTDTPPSHTIISQR